MQFQVPQFIEIEDKIFGPLTFKQFLFVVGGGGLAFIFYNLPMWGSLKFFLVIASAGTGCAFAFLKIGHKPLLSAVEDALLFYAGKRLYLWKKELKPIVKKDSPYQTNQATTPILSPSLSQSKLKDLTWSLDVQTKKEKM